MNYPDSPAEYNTVRIVLDEKLTDQWQEWFEDFQIRTLSDHTVISGRCRDRNELHGILKRIHDLHLNLRSVEVTPVAEKNTDGES